MGRSCKRARRLAASRCKHPRTGYLKDSMGLRIVMFLFVVFCFCLSPQGGFFIAVPPPGGGGVMLSFFNKI